MHKTTTLLLGKFGLATALVCLYHPGAAQHQVNPAQALVAAHFSKTVNAEIPKMKPSASLVVDISGKVTDEKGDPLPGVTVVVKGTTTGTATGADAG